MVMTYRGGFSTSKNVSFWHLLIVQVYLIPNSHDSLYLNCYMVVIWTVMAVKIFLFQAYSNLIRHLQLESCKIGEVASSKERKKNTHTNSSVIITLSHNLFCLLIELCL